jgi:hypothetical protein
VTKRAQYRNIKSMNLLIPFFSAFLNATLCVLGCYAATDPSQNELNPPPQVQEPGPAKKDSLVKKVVRMPLNQNEPIEVKVGLSGITTLQFPAKIEAINGYGFALQPNPDSDVFNLIYDKGTNFLSLKALRAGVSANLSVVINEKVYCFYCEQDNDPVFVMIFGVTGEQSGGADVAQAQSIPEKKEIGRDQLVVFLGKLKDYVRLKAVSPESVSTLSVAEPNKKAEIGEIETVIKRVVRDDSLGLVGFDVDLSNRGQSDYYLDPEGFAVRVRNARYEESISDCGGIVPAGTSVSAFFVVSEAASGGQSNLTVDQDFEMQIRASGSANNSALTENFVEPPQRLPATNPGKESSVKVNSGARDTPKEGKVTPKKAKQPAAQVSTKDHAVKAGDSAAKKHWYDLFRRNSVTVE